MDSGGFPYSAVKLSNVGGHLWLGTESQYEMISCLNCLAREMMFEFSLKPGKIVSKLVLKTTSEMLLLG